MFQQLVVPIDGSAASWAAVPIAARLAETVDGKIEVVTVVDRLGDVVTMERELAEGVERLDDLPLDPTYSVLAGDEIAPTLANYVEARPGTMVLMSSHGHGRSAAVLGSVVDSVLRRMFGPIIVIGPHVEADSGNPEGDYVVAVDGSDPSETIVPIAQAWAIEFNAMPWLLEVIDPEQPVEMDVFESAYAARLAHRIFTETGHEVSFDVLHDVHPSRALVDYAQRLPASMIFMCTHGRTGMARLRLGSVAAETVRHATCPVVLYRPPDLAR